MSRPLLLTVLFLAVASYNVFDIILTDIFHYWQIGHFHLMCAVDKDWITELTLIHKNIRSVRNSHISQSDVMSSPFTLKIFLGEIKGKMYY